MEVFKSSTKIVKSLIKVNRIITKHSLYFDATGRHKVEASPSHCVFSKTKPFCSLWLANTSRPWLCRCWPFLWQHRGHDRVPAVPRAEVLLDVRHAAHLWGEIPTPSTLCLLLLSYSYFHAGSPLCLFPLMFSFVFIISYLILLLNTYLFFHPSSPPYPSFWPFTYFHFATSVIMLELHRRGETAAFTWKCGLICFKTHFTADMISTRSESTVGLLIINRSQEVS